MVANRDRSPMQAFNERAVDLNTSSHYTSQPMTAERVASLDSATMLRFYRERFANAADFSFFMVGAFVLDEAIPLLAQYIGSLPSTGTRTSQFRDVARRFPASTGHARVERGQEPRSRALISFFSDPPPDPLEQEKLSAAISVLQIALRDVLREELGQTYTVSVGLSQSLPQRGDGHIQVSFGASPENIDAMTERVGREIKRMQSEGPPADLVNRVKESARRDYETALKQNGYWLRRLDSAFVLGRDPEEILRRNERIDAVTPQAVQDMFTRYFPFDRSTTVTLVPAPAR
jgi:zinc protease